MKRRWELGVDPTFDRRRFPRLDSEALVSIAPLEQNTALAHAADLSLGGVRLQCVGMDVRPGEMLRVTLTLGEQTVHAIGQCVRADPLDDIAQDVALRFLKMADETRELLRLQLQLGASEDDPRREFARVALDSVIAVERANMLDMVAQARDVSAGGIHFIVEGLEVALGDVLRVTVDVDGEPLGVVGQLVRVTDLGDAKQEAALAFLEGGERILERLRQRAG